MVIICGRAGRIGVSGIAVGVPLADCAASVRSSSNALLPTSTVRPGDCENATVPVNVPVAAAAAVGRSGKDKNAAALSWKVTRSYPARTIVTVYDAPPTANVARPLASVVPSTRPVAGTVGTPGSTSTVAPATGSSVASSNASTVNVPASVPVTTPRWTMLPVTGAVARLPAASVSSSE